MFLEEEQYICKNYVDPIETLFAIWHFPVYIIDKKLQKCYWRFFLEVVIKIEVKDNNIEQALRVLKRKLQRDGFFKVIKLKNTYEKPSEKKKRILQENIKRVKKLNKLKNRI